MLKLDNNRKLGLLLGAAFAIIAFWGSFKPWAAAIGAGFAGVAFAAPALLAPVTRAWMALGHLLGRIVNPLVMGVIFYGMITPIALVRRLRGTSPIPMRPDPSAATYWKTRAPPGPDPATLQRQF